MSSVASPQVVCASDIAVVGRSCRLPGAASIPAFWQLLIEERCAVTTIPPDRWPLQRHWHPRQAERGRTYTWAAGVLDDIWAFDAAAFGISPREAEQMDPQQRLLLELVWEALEDAGIRPSSLAGTETGVFVGASSVDHANLRLVDMAAADAYMMTGNTLSVVSNRISYIFDLHGPSFTVDTACSSSLVAVSEALASLRSGRIDTAIVAGVNLLVSPQSFIGFSQAAMLSRRGLCQAFSAHADGYVRAEGGVVLVLQTTAAAARDGNAIHALIVDAAVNSDGRTNGISLPSKGAQARLLSRLYDAESIDPPALAFIETHGTGTPVGDPIEAAAIGESLGRRREAPLPIGSLKTNIGHMEAAAGLGGMMKAMLALEHNLLPASLHSAELNPAIDFAALNLDVARRPIPLQRPTGRRRLAGINAFGFGGTNAHVVLADAPAAAGARVDIAPSYLVVSAHSRAALAALASRYARHLRDGSDAGAAAITAAAASRRDRLAHRLVMPVGRPGDMASILESLDNTDMPSIARGTPVAGGSRVAFVFSGNGSQFAGMALPAYRRNAAFARRLDAISAAFESIAGWSIVEALHADDLKGRLHRASIAQPLLFAIQSAACHSFRQLGLEPAMVVGHSVGEVAAAEAAGLLDEQAALRIIWQRSRHQELTYDHGGMAVVIGPEAAIEPILDELPGLSIAAFNSPRAFTVSGHKADLARLPEAARRHKARVRMLDLAYPFHSPLMSPVEAPLKEGLAGLAPRAPTASFISTVTGTVLGAEEIDGTYWWRNVREPVRFAQAIAVARENAAGIFIEIGPMAILLSHVGDCLDESSSVAMLAAFDKQDRGVDPLAMTVAHAIARGAAIDTTKAFGSDLSLGAKVPLPLYPWQRKTYRLAETLESAGVARVGGWHPLIGARTHPERLEWQGVIDTALHPWLADHCVGERVILPGAAFVDMALAAAREWSGDDKAILADLEILTPLQLAEDVGREVMCRISPVANLIEIFSRPRLSASPWQLHVTTKVVRDTTIGAGQRLDDIAKPSREWIDGAAIYAQAERAGLRYGPAFQALRRARRIAPDQIVVELAASRAQPQFCLDPVCLDACFHALLLAFEDRPVDTSYVPVRFGEILLIKPGAPCTRARIDVVRWHERAVTIDVTLADAAGETVAMVRDARFRPFPRSERKDVVDQIVRQIRVLAPEPTAARRDPPLALDGFRAAIRRADPQAQLRGDYVLLEGWTTGLALEAARAFAINGEVQIDELVTNGRISVALRPWLTRCLTALERSGLCRRLGRSYELDAGVDLPSPDDILAALARSHPALGVELLAASSAQACVRAIIAAESAVSLNRILADFEDHAELLRAPALALVDIVQTSIPAWPRDRATRILQLGCGPLTRPLVAIAETASVKLSVFDPDRRRLERARLALVGNDVELVDRLDDLSAAAFDLVVSTTPWAAVLSSVRRVMSPQAILAAVAPPPSFFRDFLRDLERTCDEPGGGPCRADPIDWRALATGLGLEAIETDEIETPAGAALLLTARMPAERRHRTGTGAVVIVGDAQPSALQTSFATLLASSGLHISIGFDVGAGRLQETPRAIVVFVHAEDAAETTIRLRDHCTRLKQITDGIGAGSNRLWFVFIKSARDASDALVSGLHAFSRTLANERAMLDIRRVEVEPDMQPDDLVERLHDLILSETEETDIVLDAASTRVTRFVTRPLVGAHTGRSADAVRLLRNDGVERLGWQAAQRAAPGADEVEIGVDAVGINFRDVMFGLGLLPDDILEHGFAGPTLGLECAGRVLRVGARVVDLEPGHRVMAFARNAFATHVVTPASLVVPIPGDLEPEAAATVPVAFLTAYYGLMTCARLKPREWVLIHGGAGGVGLAALQIARWRGARIIATAGSPGKRCLLRSLGAEHVFDSRSGRFVDDVRQVTGDGVAVVLNSLSGEAMERSIAVLRPFGRFVELGKRDYVANTHIGLRPFRRNLSYFGVDLDQLLVDAPQTSRRLLHSVMRLFERGKLVPLPYRAIEPGQTIEAFRLMQQSGHVGKLIMRPPNPSTFFRPAPERPLRFASDKTHLVTGGFGGFGLATARWLAANGARTIVLIGRSGAASGQAQSAVAELTAQGVRIVEVAIDVADRQAMEQVFARFGRDLPPLAGVIHAAMVLDDALLADLTPERIETVLRPKVAGADHLDQLSSSLPLDYFILYSSVTTVLGNPGQAAYVAANGYLEGLARRRRREGRPALAVAWGAIADVGVLAKSEKTRSLLESRAGVKSLPAAEALQTLGRLLSAGETDDAVVTIAPMSWSKARRHLPILGAATYRSVVGRDEAAAAETGKVDIAALVGGATPEAAHRAIVELIVQEIGRVLRLPTDDIPRKTPLSDIGLDSLMAVEFALGLEARFTLAGPLSTTASGFSVDELADHVIAIASGTPNSEVVRARHLIGRHFDPVAADLAQEAAALA